MSYVGKLLVIVQVILSLLFMAFAGAVFAMHQNWKSKHDAVQTQLNSAQESLRVSTDELVTAKREFETQLSAQKQTADQFQARNANLLAQVAALTAQQNLLEQQRETQTGLAEAKSREAQFRQEEAEKQRIENSKLQAKLDEATRENRQMKDDLFTRDRAYQLLNTTYESNLKKLAYLERVVASQKIETDPEVVAKLQSPPPPVEGLVLETRKNRANRVQFVEISIGSDDGLVKGHQLDVVRTTSESAADWLGTIRLVEVFPDSAVGEVVLPAKNGIIQEGDNVTTRF